MTVFLKARQTTALTATVLGFALAVALVGERALALPFLDLGIGSLFAKLILPLLPATAIIWSLAATRSMEERTAARPLTWYTLAYTWVAAAAFAIAALAAQSLSGGADSWAVVRNIIGYTGLAALTASMMGTVAAASTTVLIALFSLTLGRLPNGTLTPAAWPVLSSTNISSWAVAITLGAIGSTLLLLRTRAD